MDKYRFPNEKRKIMVEYIRNNPQCTNADIKRDTKIKMERIYGSMRDAFNEAGVPLTKNLKKRTKEEQRKNIIDFIKKHPCCTVTEIQKSTKTNLPRLFGNIEEAYKAARVKYPKREFSSGVICTSVIKRCKLFEKRIIKLLRHLGNVKPQVRTPAGIIDCILEYKNQKYVVEIKDFRARNNITMSQIKQLKKYMDVLNYKNGLIICPKESFPKIKNSRNIYIDNTRIKILSAEDLMGM